MKKGLEKLDLKKVNLVLLIVAVILHVICLCFIIHVNSNLKKQSKILFDQTEEKIKEVMEQNEKQHDELMSASMQIYDSLESLTGSVHKSFSENRRKVNAINRVVDKINTDEMNKILSASQDDETVSEKRSTADALYQNKKYKDSIKLYEEVLSVRPDDLASREKYVLGLYYSNPLDSSNYKKIKNEINILSKNGVFTPELQKVLDGIQSE